MLSTNRSKKKQGEDAAVQGTNDNSVVSKASAAAQGYFQDDFLKHFVCKVSRRAPLINRGYYIRWSAVDYCVKRFLEVTKNCTRRQILSLGAGFDSLYFRLWAEGALQGVVVYEVDFSDVARRKAALIGRSGDLQEALLGWVPPAEPPSGPVLVRSGQYTLLGVDVRDEEQVEECLTAAGLQWGCPTLLLSEVVLTYMETRWSDSVIAWAARLLPQSMFVMYEQLRPHDPFGEVMQEHFRKLNSTLHALTDYPDASAQTQRFLDKGWEQCVCVDMNQFHFGLLSEEERQRVESLEPFDEFEEWHQKCSHYFILTASKGSLTSQSLITTPKDSPLPQLSPQWGDVSLPVRPVGGGVCVEGLGLASALLRPGVVVLSGGASRAGRDPSARLLIRGQSGWSCERVDPQPEWGVRLYHTVTAVPGWGAVVIGGRSSPLQPISSVFRVTSDPSATVGVRVEEMCCTGAAPDPRWRHSTTLLTHAGRGILCVFGGRSHRERVLGDAHFLCVENHHWTQYCASSSISKDSSRGQCPRSPPLPFRMPLRGGLVMFGGLGHGGVPRGDVVLLKPTPQGFHWDRLQVQPPLVPRYSHSSHVIGEKLVVLGGVWLQAEGVPGVAVVNLTTGSSMELNLDTSSVPWPLMLHSFCSELPEGEGSEVMLIGGGGNCFSFGTHLNPRPVWVDLGPVL